MKFVLNIFFSCLFFAAFNGAGGDERCEKEDMEDARRNYVRFDLRSLEDVSMTTCLCAFGYSN
jgi:hypothetical protein